MFEEQQNPMRYEQTPQEFPLENDSTIQLDFQKSNLPSMAEIEARKNIEALLSGVSNVATEALKSHIEISKNAPQTLLLERSKKIVSLRKGYDIEHISLTHEELPDLNLFERVPQINPNDKKSDFDLAA